MVFYSGRDAKRTSLWPQIPILCVVAVAQCLLAVLGGVLGPKLKPIYEAAGASGGPF